MELLTQRLLLRPFRVDDAHAVVQGLNNINVSRNLARVKFPYTVEDAQAFFNFQSTFDKRSVFCAIAFRAAPDELIGTISYDYQGEADPVFGYWLRECCWHMGLMSEAAAALVQHAFTKGSLTALKSGFHNDNPHSGRILRRIGFVETHQDMSFSLAQNCEVPHTTLRLTREDWLAQQKSRAA